MIASALPEDGMLYTLESDERHAMMAREYFDRAPYDSRITLILGDARQSIQDIEGPIG